jgi:uncharacterized protein YkwD
MDIEKLLIFLREQNYLDVFLYIAIFYVLVKGWKKGFLINFYYCTTLVTGIALSFRFSDFVGNFIQGWLNSKNQVSEIIAGIVIFLGVLTVSSILISILSIKKRNTPLDFGSSFFGSLISFIWINLVFSLVLNLGNLFIFPTSIQKITQESKLVSFYINPTSLPQDILSMIAGTDILKSLNKITQLTGSSSHINGCLEIEKALDRDIILRPDLALDLISTVNNHRLDLSLDYLENRQSLSDVAERYAHRMYMEGFFCHQDPLNSSEAKERLENNNINFNSIGENLVLAASLDLAHESILRSTKHKETMESSSYRYIGVGVVEGPLGLIVVQLFTGG